MAMMMVWWRGACSRSTERSWRAGALTCQSTWQPLYYFWKEHLRNTVAGCGFIPCLTLFSTVIDVTSTGEIFFAKEVFSSCIKRGGSGLELELKNSYFLKWLQRAGEKCIPEGVWVETLELAPVFVFLQEGKLIRQNSWRTSAKSGRWQTPLAEPHVCSCVPCVAMKTTAFHSNCSNMLHVSVLSSVKWQSRREWSVSQQQPASVF